MQKLKRQAEDIRQRYVSDGEHGKPVGHNRAARLVQPLCAGYMVLTANPCWIHARVVAAPWAEPSICGFEGFAGFWWVVGSRPGGHAGTRRC